MTEEIKFKEEIASLQKILEAIDYQPRSISRPKNMIGILDLDGEIEDFDNLEKILALEEQTSPLRAHFRFYYEHGRDKETYAIFLEIERKEEHITISVDGNFPCIFSFAIALKDNGIRFFYWDRTYNRFVCKINCKDLPQEYERFDIKVLWEKTPVISHHPQIIKNTRLILAAAVLLFVASFVFYLFHPVPLTPSIPPKQPTEIVLEKGIKNTYRFCDSIGKIPLQIKIAALTGGLEFDPGMTGTRYPEELPEAYRLKSEQKMVEVSLKDIQGNKGWVYHTQKKKWSEEDQENLIDFIEGNTGILVQNQPTLAGISFHRGATQHRKPEETEQTAKFDFHSGIVYWDIYYVGFEPEMTCILAAETKILSTPFYLVLEKKTERGFIEWKPGDVIRKTEKLRMNMSMEMDAYMSIFLLHGGRKPMLVSQQDNSSMMKWNKGSCFSRWINREGTGKSIRVAIVFDHDKTFDFDKVLGFLENEKLGEFTSQSKEYVLIPFQKGIFSLYVASIMFE